MADRDAAERSAKQKHDVPIERPSHCSRCGLCPLDVGVELSQVKGLPKPPGDDARQWFECPKEGPGGGWFWDGPEPTRVRSRTYFAVPGGMVQLCTPWWIEYPKDDSGRTKRKEVFAFSADDLIDKWYIRRALQKRGPSKEFDIAALPEEVREGDNPSRGVKRTTGGIWVLCPVAFDRWSDWQAHVLLWCHGHRIAEAPVREVISALTPHSGFSNRMWHDMRKATLYVPFDLRMSIDNTLDRILPDLKAIQENLLEMCGRKRVMQQESDELAWRDVYIYLLCEVDGVSKAEVAAGVFQGERPRPAQAKVRSILSRLRREVEGELQSAIQNAQHLKCARTPDAGKKE